MWATVVGGSMNPAASAANRNWDKLVDGQISFQGAPTYDTQTNTGSTSPWITLTLDQVAPLCSHCSPSCVYPVP